MAKEVDFVVTGIHKNKKTSEITYSGIVFDSIAYDNDKGVGGFFPSAVLDTEECETEQEFCLGETVSVHVTKYRDFAKRLICRVC